jgi:hypothetical protein
VIEKRQRREVETIRPRPEPHDGPEFSDWTLPFEGQPS